jgi:hypothetical protein
MKLLTGVCLILLPTIGFGQLPQRVDTTVYPGGGSLALILASAENNGVEAARLADQDISAGHLFLILQSGIAPVVYTSDSTFCEDFGIKYWEEGCSGPHYVCMRAYNRQMFAHLTALYGKVWQRTVRHDVAGYKDWKRKH